MLHSIGYHVGVVLSYQVYTGESLSFGAGKNQIDRQNTEYRLFRTVYSAEDQLTMVLSF